MKKIMILGASILQLPAILKAKDIGLQVIAVDMDRSAIGFSYADICLDISTLDIPKVVEAARKYEIDGIMTLASDMPVRTVAAVAKELNIVGISEDTALKATNKALMRECLRKDNVSIPNFFIVNSFDEYLNKLAHVGDKVIVKPADNSGSRGVFLLDNINNMELVQYAFNYSKKYSRNGDILIEEYMEGFEVSVETISVDGQINIIAITDKLTTGAPRFVEMGHSQPSILSRNIQKEISKITIEAINSIGIKNGPAHTEIIVTAEGPKIVEIGARLGGDNITTHLVPLSTGIDMVNSCIKIALGEVPDLTKKYTKGAAIRYIDSKPGRIISIKGVEEAKLIDGVKEVILVKSINDIIHEISNSSDRIGFIIAQGNTLQDAIQICEKAMKNIKIEIE